MELTQKTKISALDIFNLGWEQSQMDLSIEEIQYGAEP